jgi:hypothetical protein
MSTLDRRHKLTVKSSHACSDIRVRSTGSKPTILFLHGFPCTAKRLAGTDHPIKQGPNNYKVGMVRDVKISGNWTGLVDSSSGRGNHATSVAGFGLNVQ